MYLLTNTNKVLIIQRITYYRNLRNLLVDAIRCTGSGRCPVFTDEYVKLKWQQLPEVGPNFSTKGIKFNEYEDMMEN